MGKRLAIMGVAAASVLLSAQARAADRNSAAEEKEPSAVLELGAGSEWSLKDGTAGLGPSVGIEFEPIKGWLEIEASVSRLNGAGQIEWGTDLVFKKPFTLSDKVEYMIGVGPEWKHTMADGISVDSIAGEVVSEFMIWPTGEHTVGWFLQQTYTYDFGSGHEQSFSVTAGLTIGIP